MKKVLRDLSSTRPPPVADLKVIQFGFKTLDGTVSHFQILVESITFRNKLQGYVSVIVLKCVTDMERTCCSHCLNLDSSVLTCSVKRLRRALLPL
jgi:hypothetical protein